MKQREVTILGQSYILGCPDGGETSLLEAVGNVDREMSAIRDAGKVKARERIAVLAALNLAYRLAEQPAPPAATPASPPAGATVGGPDLDALVQRLDADAVAGKHGRDLADDPGPIVADQLEARPSRLDHRPRPAPSRPSPAATSTHVTVGCGPTSGRPPRETGRRPTRCAAIRAWPISSSPSTPP